MQPRTSKREIKENEINFRRKSQAILCKNIQEKTSANSVCGGGEEKRSRGESDVQKEKGTCTEMMAIFLGANLQCKNN